MSRVSGSRKPVQPPKAHKAEQKKTETHKKTETRNTGWSSSNTGGSESGGGVSRGGWSPSVPSSSSGGE